MDIRTSSQVHLAFTAGVVTLVGAHLLSEGLVRNLVLVTTALVAASLIGWALLHRPFPDRRPWTLLWLGVTALLVFRTLATIDLQVSGRLTTGPFPVIGPVLVFAGSLVVGSRLLLASNRRALSATLDASVLAISVSLVAWMLVLNPYLTRADVPANLRHTALAAVLAMGVAAGTGLSTARAVKRPNVALRYLLVAAAAMGAGIITRALAITAENLHEAWWVAPIWIVGLCATAAGVTHPSATELTVDRPQTGGRVTPAFLVGMGGALAVGPIIAIVQDLRGEPVNGVAIGAGALVVIPLVMVRIADLARTRAAAERQLARLALYDELTGLANRRELDAQVVASLGRLARDEAPGVVVVFCDLDGFKVVNDEHGHHIGDQVLVIAARRLRSALRQQDFVARFGGDEFVVVAEGDPGRITEETSRRITGAFADPIRLDGVTASLGVSVGAAVAHPGDDVSPERLLARADAAMYRSKELRHAKRSPAPVGRGPDAA